jgi:ubiquinone/menaquinone biosynthesis C-methylase UbiE
MSGAYVHGYSTAEESRLSRQAGILNSFIHDRAGFAPGSRILEAGCGTGAQTLQLALRNPKARFVAIDLSMPSLQIARQRIEAHSLLNVAFQQADIHELPFGDGAFDGAFLCFVLEHLTFRERALREIRRVLKPGSTVHVFEGDHGSVLAWPDDPAIQRLVNAVSQYQHLQGGDPHIGRRLYPILSEAGFENVRVEPCMAYADGSRPDWIDEFTQATFIDMMRGQETAVLERGLLTEREWQAGMTALSRTATLEGTFCYTFFRAVAKR